MALDFQAGKGEDRNWIIAETAYDPRFTGKLESIFCLQNGYMGVRAATEERSAEEHRGCYIAGVFDATKGEVTELANVPDWLNCDIDLDGESFSACSGTLVSYQRMLDMKRGLVRRELEWEGQSGKRTRILFERFVSIDDLHAAALRILIEPLNYSGDIGIRSGLNGQVTNSGVQHFLDGELRMLPDGCIAISAHTQESNIGVSVAARHLFRVAGKPLTVEEKVETSRRQIFLASRHQVGRGEALELTKHAAVFSDRDPEMLAVGRDSEKTVFARTIESLRTCANRGYDRLKREHTERWRAVWESIGVRIDGLDFDQLAVRFAQFHLYQMTPLHDERLSIAAKGLSGEGYKGHVFWDTEIFMLPLFTFTLPDVARRLLLYRYHTLDGARGKARENGYRGAMYAWESADKGNEVTPKIGAVDIRSGAPIRILSGDIEQHITCDVVYALWQYFLATGDRAFLLDHGLEIMLETARFWASRVTYNEAKDRYEIIDVMGPDEYGEHVNNNAFTNWMVRWQLEHTAKVAFQMRKEEAETWRRLEEKVGINGAECEQWSRIAARMFVNSDPKTGFICQYDGFLEKRKMDVSKYSGKVGAILRDYGWEEIRHMQVCKQADTVMLLYLDGEDFSNDVKKLNWDFYEPRTLHDSSLSPAIHAIVATDMRDLPKAYDYFARAATIDLGNDPQRSTDGLHAASLGGLWQAAVNGFGGVRITREGGLRISPRLPRQWKGLRFSLSWRKNRIAVEVGPQQVRIVALTHFEQPLPVEIHGSAFMLSDGPGIVASLK